MATMNKKTCRTLMVKGKWKREMCSFCRNRYRKDIDAYCTALRRSNEDEGGKK